MKMCFIFSSNKKRKKCTFTGTSKISISFAMREPGLSDAFWLLIYFPSLNFVGVLTLWPDHNQILWKILLHYYFQLFSPPHWVSPSMVQFVQHYSMLLCCKNLTLALYFLSSIFIMLHSEYLLLFFPCNQCWYV